MTEQNITEYLQNQKAGDTVTIKFRTQRNNVDSVYLVSQEQRVQMEILRDRERILIIILPR